MSVNSWGHFCLLLQWNTFPHQYGQEENCFNRSCIFTFNIKCSSLNRRGQTENGLHVGEEDTFVLDPASTSVPASFVRLLTALT